MIYKQNFFNFYRFNELLDGIFESDEVYSKTLRILNP